ncbi:MAG: trigger factor, partial [Saezia sp.]
PSFKQKSEDAPEGQMAFDAEFEIFPEVTVKDLSKVKLEKIETKVDDEAINKTIDVLRRQRSTFNQRPAADAAVTGDRATVDFEGKIDGEAFAGGKAENYPFVLGEGQMLKEFEDAVLGMKLGETKTFQLTFPEDYHGKDVAGKQSDFLITLKKLEERVMPEINDDFAKALGVAESSVDGLRSDIRKNLEREVNARVLRRNKEAVMDVLVDNAELELPNSIVQSEIQNMMKSAREEMRARGMKDIDNMPIPEDLFKVQAERRVRLGLIVSNLVKEHKLEATADQIKAHIDELSASYEKPEEVVRWYYSDVNRLSEVEGIVLEANVTDYVLGKAKVSEKEISFDELMERQ